MIYALGVVLMLCVGGLGLVAVGFLAGIFETKLAILLVLTPTLVGWMAAEKINEIEEDI